MPRSLEWLERMNQEKNECWQILQDAKWLSKRLKHHQTLPWNYGEYGRLLSSRAIADILVNSYFHTFETTHRILHVPSFKVQYDRLWEDTENTPIRFTIQLQLCLALGSLFYDDQFSMRPHVMQWIKEAGVWLESSAKPHLDFFTIQTLCLHRIARETMQGIYGDRVWILSGSLIRATMSIGLHRDPAKLPGFSHAQAEMRRRLWITVLELTLSSCSDPGCAPLISLDDYDCILPSNFDDIQLDLEAKNIPLPQSPESYTDSSMQIALGSSLATRLAIAKFSTSSKASDYQEALKLNTEFTGVCDSLSACLQPLRSRLSDFQRQYCELCICRYIFTLHIPYMVIWSRNRAYMLSRKACVDAALNLVYASLPLASTKDPLLMAVQAMNVSQPPGSDFLRLCVCASGPYRSAVFQAIMVIAAELVALVGEAKNSLRQSMSLSRDSNFVCGDGRILELLSILRMATEWTRSRMQAGQEINKDHLFVALALTSIDALMKGEPVKEAMETRGTTICSEIIEILEGLTDGIRINDDNLAEDDLSPDMDFLGVDDTWMMQNEIFDIDFYNL